MKKYWKDKDYFTGDSQHMSSPFVVLFETYLRGGGGTETDQRTVSINNKTDILKEVRNGESMEES